MKQFVAVLVATASLFLFACQQKPIDYQPIGDIPQGPGLFSGEDGEFNLYHSRNQPSADTNASQQDKEQATQSERNHQQEQDYQNFKAWQARQGDTNSSEYQEFKAWQEWKALQQTQQQ